MASIVRVLRPGGRVSVFEPLWLFFDEAMTPNEFFGREMSGCEVEIAAVMAGYREDLQSTLDNPLTAESLVAAAEAAGLGSIRATVEVESRNLPAVGGLVGAGSTIPRPSLRRHRGRRAQATRRSD